MDGPYVSLSSRRAIEFQVLVIASCMTNTGNARTGLVQIEVKERPQQIEADRPSWSGGAIVGAQPEAIDNETLLGHKTPTIASSARFGGRDIYATIN
jgi:hypothetical protein